MRAILDRLDFIEAALQSSTDQVSARTRALQDLQEIRTIAETLPDLTIGGAIAGYEIARLRIEPADVVVVKCHGHVDRDTFERISMEIRKYVGDAPVLILDKTIDLSVLTKTKIDLRTDAQRQPPERIIDLPVK